MQVEPGRVGIVLVVLWAYGGLGSWNKTRWAASNFRRLYEDKLSSGLHLLGFSSDTWLRKKWRKDKVKKIEAVGTKVAEIKSKLHTARGWFNFQTPRVSQDKPSSMFLSFIFWGGAVIDDAHVFQQPKLQPGFKWGRYMVKYYIRHPLPCLKLLSQKKGKKEEKLDPYH